MITISVNPAVHDEPLALDTIYSLRVVTERLGKKSNAVDFKVLSGDPLTVIPAGSVPGAPDQPFINRLNDSLFCPGDILTLIGGGFGGTQGRGSVTINVPFLDAGGSVFFQPFGAVIHSWSDGVVAVSLVLPAGALPGNYTATVLRENGKSAAVAFTVGAIVNGACVIPTPQTGVDVADLDFGAQALNTTSAERTILLTNTSAVPLRIINVTFNGPHQGDFRFTGGDSGGILAPGDTRVITLTFRPTALGLRTARVDLITDAPSSPDSVALTGIGE
jgi:hypothetical protein